MRRGLISCFQFRWNILPPSPDQKDLLRIKFDDQLSRDRVGDVRPRRQRLDAAAEILPLQLEPDRNPLPGHGIQGLVDGQDLPASFPYFAHIAGTDEIGGNVDPASRHEEMTMPDQLPALPARHRESELEHHVVQAPLPHDQQGVAGPPLHPVRFLEIVVELFLQESVYSSCLLLLPQLDPVVAVLRPTLPVLTGGISPALDGATGGKATVSLQVQLHPFASAKTANRFTIPGQRNYSSYPCLLRSNPSPFRRAGPVVWDGGHRPGR